MRGFYPTYLIPLCLALLLPACSTPRPGSNGASDHGFNPAQLAKTDIDRVADAHLQQVNASLRLLAEKLYKRNPHEWRKSGQPNLETAVARLFANPSWRFAELEGKFGTDAVLLGLREDYAGDRVLAVIAGLGGMLNVAFNEKDEFFMLDDLDPQKLYNAARNLEIADWKLSNARDKKHELLLLSNEMTPIHNLSFEREFGKMIGSLDLLSALIADKTNRTVAKVAQSMATAVFLPVTLLR